MGELITHIQEENFAKSSTSSYDLSILVGMDRFFYAVTDGQQHLLLLKSYQLDEKASSISKFKESLQRVFLNDKLLQLPFHKTYLSFVNHKSTLVPHRLFDENQKETYLQQLIQLGEDDYIDVNYIAPLDVHLVYSISHTILKEIRAYFPTATIYHAQTPLLFGYRKLMEHQQGHQIFLNVKMELLQLALFDGPNLIFCNNFNYHASKDFIYYVMLIFDQFDLKPESTPIHLSGLIETNSEIYQQLFRYVRHLNFIQQPSFIRFGAQSSTMQTYFYYDLFCLKLCE